MTEISISSAKISSKFTSSLGAGYKNFDNPQIKFSLEVPPSLISSNSNNDATLEALRTTFSSKNLLSTIRISFEMRRKLPINSPHHSEGLG